jgi:hypothetical protein
MRRSPGCAAPARARRQTAVTSVVSAAKPRIRRSSGGASPIGSAFGTSRTTSGSAANASSTPSARRAAQQQALRQQLAREALAPGAERRAHRELLPPLERAREEQAREVRAGDQQHAERRAQEREQQQPRLPRQLVAQATTTAPPTFLFSLRVLALELRRHERRSRRGRNPVGRRLQPRDALEVEVVAPLEGLASHRIGSQSCVSRRGRGSWGHHADHLVGLVVEQQLAAEHRGSPPKRSLPQAVAQHHRARRALAVLSAREGAGRAAAACPRPSGPRSSRSRAGAGPGSPSPTRLTLFL